MTLGAYCGELLSGKGRRLDARVQTKDEKREKDAVQACHWTISLLKRWLLGTHAGAVKPKHLPAFLDEFAFRHNRRRLTASHASQHA